LDRHLAKRGQYDPLRDPRRLRGRLSRRHGAGDGAAPHPHPPPHRGAALRPPRSRPQIDERVPRLRETAPRPALREALTMADESHKKVPYAKYAFLNPYNLSLLAGAGTVAAATQNWFLGVLTVGAEALWMLFAPGSKLLQRTVWDKKHAAILAAAESE